MQADSADDSPAETVVRLDRIGSATGERTLSVSLDAKGTENALGFSLLFDPTKLSFVGVERGPGSENAMMQVNSLGTSKGRLGVAMALPANQAFGVGSHQLFRINFKVLKDAEETPDPAFADLPIEREVADLKAARIRADFIKDSVARVNPIDGAQFFIQQHYTDFLGRKPDIEGLDYWTNQITECGDDAGCIRDRRIRVSASFFMEQEFQQRGFFVHRLYKVLLGRQPSYAEFSRDRARLQSDDLESAKISLIQEMLSRPDLEARYSADLTPEQFLDALFTTIRGGSGLDLQGERQALRNASEERGRAQVVLTLINNSRLVQAEYNPAFVLAEYFGYLRRDPDREGYDFWLNVLNNRVPNNYHSMVCAFITSAEYQRRFGDTAGRSNADCGP
jgi:hypothetical protein